MPIGIRSAEIATDRSIPLAKEPENVNIKSIDSFGFPEKTQILIGKAPVAQPDRATDF
jgi:hypothetical protein